MNPSKLISLARLLTAGVPLVGLVLAVISSFGTTSNGLVSAEVPSTTPSRNHAADTRVHVDDLLDHAKADAKAKDKYDDAESEEEDATHWDGESPLFPDGENSDHYDPSMEEQPEDYHGHGHGDHHDGDDHDDQDQEDFDPAEMERMLLEMFGGDHAKMDTFMKQLESGNFDEEMLAQLMPPPESAQGGAGDDFLPQGMFGGDHDQEQEHTEPSPHKDHTADEAEEEGYYDDQLDYEQQKQDEILHTEL